MGEHGIDDARISDSDIDPGRRLIQCDELGRVDKPHEGDSPDAV